MDTSTDNTNIRKNNTSMTAVEVLGVILSALIIATFPIHLFIWFANGVSYANTNQGSEYWFYTNYFPFILSMFMSGIIIASIESKKKKVNIKNTILFSIFMYIVSIASIIIGGIICFSDSKMPINAAIAIVLIYIFVIVIEYTNYIYKKYARKVTK